VADLQVAFLQRLQAGCNGFDHLMNVRDFNIVFDETTVSTLVPAEHQDEYSD
jgi:hypothetical protein